MIPRAASIFPACHDDCGGKRVLRTFGSTNCADLCPTPLAKFAQARRVLGTAAAQVHGIFITVDSQRDSASMLHAYLVAFDPSFVGRRGTPAQTDAAARSFHAGYEIVQSSGTTSVDHTVSTYIIDPMGRVRVVALQEKSASMIAEDVGTLLPER